MKYIPQSFDSMLGQTFKDIEVIAVINGNNDKGKEYIAEHYPSVKIIDPGENLKFVRGHNLIFERTDTDFFQLVNQDLILEPTYVEKMIQAFEDPAVGAANGKIYQYDFTTNTRSKKIDTTGITYTKSGRGRSRGQHEIDEGQYDTKLELIGVDGAACMYRKSALEAVKYLRPDGQTEYFDIDFDMYWEDVDLSLRIINAGFACRFVPDAIGFHGRTATSSPGGYKKVFAFISHHKKVAPWILQNNYKNHIFLFLKNSPRWYIQFFIREFFYQAFVLVIETRTLKILPLFFKQLPLMWQKRKWIRKHSKISAQDFTRLLTE